MDNYLVNELRHRRAPVTSDGKMDYISISSDNNYTVRHIVRPSHLGILYLTS